jgi:hypothetical protein
MVGVVAVGAMGQGLTLVPTSAQLELYLPRFRSTSRILPNLTRGCGTNVLKLSSNVSDVSRRSSS